MTLPFTIRDATAADLGAILALNLESEQVLSPLDEDRLAQLHERAAYHRAVCNDGVVVAFLLAFREGADYDSPNYRWFAQRYPSFLYIDRIVVAAAHQGRQLGGALYRDLFSFARDSGVATVACEFDVVPFNAASSRFHAKFGFDEVGTQWVAGGKKQVSLQTATA